MSGFSYMIFNFRTIYLLRQSQKIMSLVEHPIRHTFPVVFTRVEERRPNYVVHGNVTFSDKVKRKNARERYATRKLVRKTATCRRPRTPAGRLVGKDHRRPPTTRNCHRVYNPEGSASVAYAFSRPCLENTRAI